MRQPMSAKPSSIVAQVPGSGTAGGATMGTFGWGVGKLIGGEPPGGLPLDGGMTMPPSDGGVASATGQSG